MMGVVPLPGSGSVGGSGMDMTARTAAAAAHLRSDEAYALAAAGGSAISGTVTKTVRLDGSGDFASVGVALEWFRAQDRRSGARGVIDVLGSFVEDLPPAPDGADEHWLRVRGSYEPERVATGPTSVGLLASTTDCYLVVVPLAAADVAGLVVGDGVYGHCNAPNGGSDAQDRMTGVFTVYSTASSSVTLVARGQAPSSIDSFRIVRPRGQIVTSQTITAKGGRTWRPENILIRANSPPQIRGAHNLFYLDGARMSVVDSDEATGVHVPSLLLVNSNCGLVLVEALSAFEGSVALCNMRREGTYCQGAFYPSVVIATGNGADAVAIAGSGSMFSVRRRPNDAKSIIKRGLGAGVSTLTLAQVWFEANTLLCSGHAFVDFYSANLGQLFTLGLTGSTYSPGAGSTGNNGATNLVFAA